MMQVTSVLQPKKVFHCLRRKPTKLLNMVCATDCIFQSCLNKISQPIHFSYNVTLTLQSSRDRCYASSLRNGWSSVNVSTYRVQQEARPVISEARS